MNFGEKREKAILFTLVSWGLGDKKTPKGKVIPFPWVTGAKGKCLGQIFLERLASVVLRSRWT
jgi:hypothetical protein